MAKRPSKITRIMWKEAKKAVIMYSGKRYNKNTSTIQLIKLKFFMLKKITKTKEAIDKLLYFISSLYPQTKGEH